MWRLEESESLAPQEEAQKQIESTYMIALILPTMFAAAGYSLIYLLGGGGLFGAFVIFVIAKMLGR
jgi:hypothetical protein